MARVHDLAVIGGGINGCGIARDAVGRGLSVYLCEMNDLASGTSSWSTKLIHGGLRYLEYYEFRLVREALMERELLWAMAPHIVRPLRFVLPHHKGLRPAWLLRLGLLIYDNLGGRKALPATATVDLTADQTGTPLKAGLFSKGFEYSDCWVDDARLVVLNARDAADKGAIIAPRTRAISAERHPDHWVLTVEDTATGTRQEIRAKVLVNAAGPWVARVLQQTIRLNAEAKVRLVQGSHIVVPKLYDHDRCYIFQNADRRIIFAIPYEQDFTLIGTTDRDYTGDPADVAATPDEIAYLCAAASEYFAQPVTPESVVWTYSGVRPLYDDGASEARAATREYVLELDAREGLAPVLSVFGGKITTFRRLADTVLEKLTPHLPTMQASRRHWTATSPLPGGDFAINGQEKLASELRHQQPALSEADALRLARAYGSRARSIVSAPDLGEHFGGGLTAAEVRYLMREEWATTSDDVLWRRSKLGLRLSKAQVSRLDAFMQGERALVAGAIS